MRFLAAWQFLTVFPVSARYKASPIELGQSLGYFPLVGLILGLALAGLNWVLDLALPSLLVNVLLIIALIGLTGALHLEGFIDACDGALYSGTPQERLIIMSDPRKGSFGVIGGCCLILLKYVSLAVVPGGMKALALILMPLISRWTMVYAVFAFPPAKKDGIGATVKQQANWRKMTIATAITLVPAVVLLGLGGLALTASICLIGTAAASFLKSRLGGLNGDTYGAVNEVSEVTLLIIFPFIVEATGGGFLFGYLASG